MKNISSLVLAEIQLSYKGNIDPASLPRITCSRDTVEIIRENWNRNTLELREEMKVLLLNRANRLLGILPVSAGGVSGTVADPKIIFATALKVPACGIILVHNHPSGNLSPSQADLDLTRRIYQAGTLLDVQLLDHIILTREAYYSFADEGKIRGD